MLMRAKPEKAAQVRRLMKIVKTRAPSSQTSQMSHTQLSQASDRDENEYGCRPERDLSHTLSQENAEQNAGCDERDKCDETDGADSMLADEIDELAARLEYDEHLPRAEEPEARARAFYAPPT